MTIVRKTLLCLGLLLPLSLTFAEDSLRPSNNPARDSRQDSLAAAVRAAIAGMTTPELEERKARRRMLQQHGYASVLSQTLRSDGLWSLIMYTRLSLQLEYSLPLVLPDHEICF